MGYRFTIESANTVANLTFGKVMSCYRDIFSSEKSHRGFLDFLELFYQNIYSNENERYMHDVRRLQKQLSHKNHMKFKHWDFHEEMDFDNDFLRYDEEILDSLKGLSDVFSRCKTKALLLPRLREYYSHKNDCNIDSDDFMLSADTLYDLLKYHPGDSCLILQPTERPKEITIFDAFPNFEIALRQRDLWSAVMFWDGQGDFAFVPVDDKKELRHLFKIIRYDDLSIRELKRIAERKKRPNHYILHLSDLHFGAKNVDITERRLKTLIKKQVESLDDNDSFNFVITGDILDSPNSSNVSNYRNFSEHMEERYGKKPTCVLGNHDINNHGLAFLRGKQQIANIVGDYPKIEILEEPKVILMLFNSNTSGRLAQGEIGSIQMAEMGNLLDAVDNLNRYLLVAVLHHHLIPIVRPEHYDDRWFRRIIPRKLLDEALLLNDATLFIEWLTRRNVRFVLHGHKHIPFQSEHNGIQIISCGSSTGQIVHKEKGKTYISYNLIKISDDSLTCTLFVEDILGAGAKDIKATPPQKV